MLGRAYPPRVPRSTFGCRLEERWLSPKHRLAYPRPCVKFDQAANSSVERIRNQATYPSTRSRASTQCCDSVESLAALPAGRGAANVANPDSARPLLGQIHRLGDESATSIRASRCNRVPQSYNICACPCHGLSYSATTSRGDTLPLRLHNTRSQHNMRTSDSASSSPICYFSLSVSTTHFSIETPSTTPLTAYSPDTYSDPHHPLLALRPLSPEQHMPATEASILQLQTSAAHRPNAQPLQAASASPSSASSSASGSSQGPASPSTLCCSRCRRESSGSMVQFGTNLYYCNHCARMTGYCAG